MRHFIQFSYDGARYFGYQIQPAQISVQQELEMALGTILRRKTAITGAGRTDTGVHARRMFAHFDSLEELPADLAARLNSFLPKDIAVQRIFRVKDDLHARFDALFRTYEYFICTEKDPFSRAYSWQIGGRSPALEPMNEACKILFEYEDFTSFAKVGGDNKTNLCQIFEAGWTQDGSMLKFRISANRFLRNMVRAITGTMADIGRGKLSPEDLRKVIEAKDRGAAGGSVPAHGLFLVDVGYNFD